MKIIRILELNLITTMIVFAQKGLPEQNFPDVTLQVWVKDESNKPIHNALIYANDSYLSKKIKGRYMESKTIQNGSSVLKFEALSGVSVYCEKEGEYYANIEKVILFDPFKFNPNISKAEQHDPLPFKEEVSLKKEITLRKIIKPIPLYATHVRLQFPARNVWLGYDLELADWTPPYGEGKKSDLKFRSNPEPIEVNTSNLVAEASIEIDFGIGGGMEEITSRNGFMAQSQMKMPHNAPKEDYFKQVFKLTSVNPENLGGSEDEVKNIGYFFRSRAEVVGGSVVSGNYGKIFTSSNSSPFKYYLEAKEPLKIIEGKQYKNHRIHGEIQFTYYFNPKPNDTNLEMNWKKNLFKINKIKDRGNSITAP